MNNFQTSYNNRSNQANFWAVWHIPQARYVDLRSPTTAWSRRIGGRQLGSQSI